MDLKLFQVRERGIQPWDCDACHPRAAAVVALTLLALGETLVVLRLVRTQRIQLSWFAHDVAQPRCLIVE